MYKLKKKKLETAQTVGIVEQTFQVTGKIKN